MAHPPPTTKKFQGRHKFQCEVDGMVYKSEFKRVRWDGAVVHRENLEQRQPQDMIKAVKEVGSLMDAQGELGYNSNQGNDYTYNLNDTLPTFGLVDENGTLIVTETPESIQVPQTAAVLA